MTYNERKLQTIELQNKIAKEKRKFQNQSIKDQVLFAIIAAIIITGAIYILNCQLNHAVEKCSQTHDRNYCIKKLR